MVKRLIAYLAPHKFMVAAVMATMLATTAVEMLSPWPYRAGSRQGWQRRVTLGAGVLGLFLALVTPAGGTLPGTGGPPPGSVEGAPVKNYGIVREGILSRSGLPKANGYAWLLRQGARSIVNLTTEDRRDLLVHRFGFDRYLWLPMVGPPSHAQAEQFLGFVQDSGNWPLHVHCDAGKDRSGVMVALFRYAIDGWPLERALEEAKLYRRSGLFPQYIEWLQRWAGWHPPGSHRRSGTGSGDDGR